MPTKDKAMVKVEVEFFSLIQEITKVKRKELILKKESPKLTDLLTLLFKEFGSQVEETVFDRLRNNLKPGILIAINGKNSYLLKGMETPLKDGDKIVIGYAFRGG